MDEHRQYAYRTLLYTAMLDIRTITRPRSTLAKLNPFTAIKRAAQAEEAAEIAEWLHSMAEFSRRDFSGFDEDRFWSEFRRTKVRFPNIHHFETIFRNALTESQTGEWPSIEEQRRRDA